MLVYIKEIGTFTFQGIHGDFFNENLEESMFFFKDYDFDEYIKVGDWVLLDLDTRKLTIENFNLETSSKIVEQFNKWLENE